MSIVPRYLTPDADKLKAKGVKSVSSRVVNLSELGDVTIESMSEAMIQAFQAEYGTAEISVADAAEFPEYEALLKRYQSWEWNWGASPQGNVTLKNRFPWGGVEIHAEVTGGVVKHVHVYTDSMDETLSERLTCALKGCEWRSDEVFRRLCAEEKEVARWLADMI